MVTIRGAAAADVDFMWQMLFHAARADRDGSKVEDLPEIPELARHLSGWPRAGDAGVVAVDDGESVGAAWLRLHLQHERDIVEFVALDVPELVIAVRPELIGNGIGGLLLTRLLADADRDGVPAIVLTARSDNPSIRLYGRYGFETIERIESRVGGESVKMLRPNPDMSDI